MENPFAIVEKDAGVGSYFVGLAFLLRAAVENDMPHLWVGGDETLLADHLEDKHIPTRDEVRQELILLINHGLRNFEPENRDAILDMAIDVVVTGKFGDLAAALSTQKNSPIEGAFNRPLYPRDEKVS